MMSERKISKAKIHLVTIENLVPEDDYLRKVESILDFSFIYDEVRDLYSKNNGRPSIDPVVLIKYLLLGYLEGIPSERKIEIQIKRTPAYRWFLGLELDDPVPDHSTISQNRRRRFNGQNVYRRIFERIVYQCLQNGLASGKVILTDSTHIKANASKKHNVKIMVEEKAKEYMKRLDKYEKEERKYLEEKGLIKPQRLRKKDKKPKMIERTISLTDPDAGMLNRPNKPSGMHYLSHQSIDAKNGIIVDVEVTPGNVSDSEPYLDRVEYMKNHLKLPIKALGVDSMYGTSLICKSTEDMELELYTPDKQIGGSTCKVEFTREYFKYDKEKNHFICPMGKYLTLRSLEREKYNTSRIYRAKTEDCINCPLSKKCLSESQKSRTIRGNIFEDSVKRQRQKNGTPKHKQILRLRQIWCEGSFSAQKRMYNLNCLFRRGIEAAEDHCLMSAIALNLKRMIKFMG